VLKALGIHNFRGIKEGEIKGLSQVTVFIGKNNSGKSTILEALYLASAAFNPEDHLSPIVRTTYTSKYCQKIVYLITRRHLENAYAEGLWYGYDIEKPIKITLTFSDGKTFSTIYMHDHQQPYVLMNSQKRLFLQITKKGIYKIEYSDIGSVRTAVKVDSSILNEILGNDYEHKVKFLSNIAFVDVLLTRYFRRIERTFWKKILQYRLDRFLVKLIRDGYDVNAEDLTYVPINGGFQLVVKMPTTYVRVDDLGDGVKFSLVLAMIFLTRENTLVLLEDPECHQHPHGLAKTFEALMKLAINRKLQLFITTHSIELLRIISHIAQEQNLDVSIFFLERDENGILHSRRFGIDELNALEELAIDARFLYVM